MTNLFKIFWLSVGLSVLIGCSQILQDVDLSFDKKDIAAQEDFTVVEKTLTLSEAKSRQSDPYDRQVIQQGLGNKARLISEEDAIKLDFPEFQVPAIYKIGSNDTLTFSKLALAHEVIDPLHGFFVALEKVFVANLVDEVFAYG